MTEHTKPPVDDHLEAWKAKEREKTRLALVRMIQAQKNAELILALDRYNERKKKT